MKETNKSTLGIFSPVLIAVIMVVVVLALSIFSVNNDERNDSNNDSISRVTETAKSNTKTTTGSFDKYQPKETSKYEGLTNTEKTEICEYIQDRYDYYDALEGGYAGDKYSDTIMREAARKYGITEQEAFIIWMNMYSY